MTAHSGLLPRSGAAPMAEGRVLRGGLSCMLCGRTAGVVAGGQRGTISVTPTRPEHADAVRRMQCPYCSGRLLLDETEEVVVRTRVPLTPDEVAPKRGRPPKVPAAPAAEATRIPCPHCTKKLIRPGRGGCRGCMNHIRAQAGITARLVVLLGHGEPVTVAELGRLLDLTPSAIRSAVKRARGHGRRIVRPEGQYGAYQLLPGVES